MNRAELYRELGTAIGQRKSVSFITITHSTRSDWITKRMLLFTHEHYAETGLPISLAEKIEKQCHPFRMKGKNRSLSFSWENESISVFLENFPPPPHLIIAGAGHVGEPVAQMAKLLGFHTTIVDDRPEYANEKRFPWGDEIRCEPFDNYFRTVPLTPFTYVLLLTRGHQFDVLSLQQLLSREERPAYIGMIGSRRRIAGVFEQLRTDFPESSFSNVYTPVGLNIGAETPAEIAVSMLAEILAVKNNTNGQPLSSTIRNLAERGFRQGGSI